MQTNNHKIYISFAVLSVLLLTACAGTPPVWWNPTGTYTTTGTTNSTKVQPATVQTRVVPPAEIPAEESIEASVEEEYEELKLSPLSAQSEPAASEESALSTHE